MKILVVVLLAMGAIGLASAEEIPREQGNEQVCEKADALKPIEIDGQIDLEAFLKREKTAEIEVTYLENFEAFAENNGAKEAFELAAEIYSREIRSAVPIKITVGLPSVPNSRVVAFAQAETVIGDGSKGLQEGVAYYSALADSIAGVDLQPENTYDIRIFFQADRNWNFATIPGELERGEVSFVTVALHEITHGLALVGTSEEFMVSDFLTRHLGSKIVIGEMTTAERLREINGFALNNQDVGEGPRMEEFEFFGVYASAVNNKPLLLDGRTHLDAQAHPNALMNRAPPGIRHVFNIGDDTRGILKDVGWQLNAAGIYPVNVDRQIVKAKIDDGVAAREIVTLQNVTDTPVKVALRFTQNEDKVRLVGVDKAVSLEACESAEIALEIDAPSLNGRHDISELEITVNDTPQIISVPLRVQVSNATPSARLVSNLPTNFDFTSTNSNEDFEIFKGNYFQNFGDKELSFTFFNSDGTNRFTKFTPASGTIPPGKFQHIEVSIDKNKVSGPKVHRNSTFLFADTTEGDFIEYESTLVNSGILLEQTSLSLTVDADRNPGLTGSISFTVRNTNRFGIPRLNLQVSEKANAQGRPGLLESVAIGDRQQLGMDGVSQRIDITVKLPDGQLGTSSTVLELRSDDPKFPLIEIPLQINLVSSDGRYLFFDRSSIEYGKVLANDLVGKTVSETLVITNYGNRVSRILDVEVDTENFSVAASPQSNPVTIENLIDLEIPDTRESLYSRPLINLLDKILPRKAFPKSLLPGESLTLEILYAPALEKASAGKLRVVTDTPQGSFQILLNGEGLARGELGRLTTEEDTEFFDTVQLGESATRIVEFRNTGSTNVTIGEIRIEAEALSIAGGSKAFLGTTVAPNESVSVPVVFTPQHVGYISLDGKFTNPVNIHYAVDLPSEGAKIEDVVTIEFFGYGSRGPVILQIDNLQSDFGTVTVGDTRLSPEGSVYIFNNLDTPIRIQNISIGDPANFELVATEIFGIPGDSTDNVIPRFGEVLPIVRFRPQRPGTFKTRLVIFSEDLPAPFEITYQGTAIAPQAQLNGFALVDAETSERLQEIEDGDVIDLANYGEVAIEAIPGEINPQSVLFKINGQVQRLDNRPPFFLNGQGEATPRSFELPLGSLTLTAQAFSGLQGGGESGEKNTVNISVIHSERPQVTGFLLAHKDAVNAPVEIIEGLVIRLSDYGSNDFAIIAKTGDIQATTVSFDFNAQQKVQFDTEAPFSLTGGASEIKTRPLPLGINRVGATPFGGRDSKGRLQAGMQKSVGFAIVDDL